MSPKSDNVPPKGNNFSQETYTWQTLQYLEQSRTGSAGISCSYMQWNDEEKYDRQAEKLQSEELLFWTGYQDDLKRICFCEFLQFDD